MSGSRSPFDGIDRLLDRMSQQFEESTGSRGGGGMGGMLELSGMNVDVADSGDEFVVTADLPGFEKENVDVQVRDDTLHLSASREEESEEGDEQYLRRERRRRQFSRSVSLPEPVAPDGASADLRNGVLTITLPKVEPTQRGQSIDIE